MINNNIQESYCSFEVSKLLKEKGFDNSNCEYWDWSKENIPMHVCKPTHALAIEWIRVNFGYHPVLIPTVTSFWTYKIVKVISNSDDDYILGIKSVSDLPPYKEVCGYDYSTPQEATEAALLYTLQNLIK